MYLSYWQFEDFPPFKGKVSIALSKTLTFFVGGNNSGKTRLAQTILSDGGPDSCLAVFDFESGDCLKRHPPSKSSGLEYHDEKVVAFGKGKSFSGYLSKMRIGASSVEVNGRFLTKSTKAWRSSHLRAANGQILTRSAVTSIPK